MRRDIGEFSGLAGIQLCWQSWHPESQGKAVLVIMHGGNNYCDMPGLNEFAIRLADAGFIVYSYDQRGFGRSEGIRMHMGKWEFIRGDLAAFLHFVNIKEPNIPIYAFGASFGAAQTFDQAIVSPHLLKGIILAAFSTIPLEIPSVSRLMIKVLGKFAPELKMRAEPPESYRGAKQKLKDSNLWADPLCPATMTFGNVHELMKRQRDFASQAHLISLPILHIQGTRDVIAKPDPSFLAKVSSLDRTYKMYDAEHDIFTSEQTENIIADIIYWLSERVGN